MENSELGNHSEGVRNYLKSLVEVGEPVKREEFIETYMRLSKGKKRRVNAKHSFNRMSKEKLVKFI